MECNVEVGHTQKWRLSYSLRALLVGTALTAIWLGVVSHRARQQRIAVRALKEVGGHPVYDYMLAQSDAVGGDMAKTVPPGPAWLRELVGDEYFMRPVELIFQKGRITDQGLERIRLFSGLKAIHLQDRNISDAGIPHLCDLESVEHLSLSGNRITDNGLAQLQGLNNLRRLDIEFNDISDAGLVTLSRFKNLDTVCAYGTRITREGVAKLQSALPGLKISCDFGSPWSSDGQRSIGYGGPAAGWGYAR
jgi:hypothetical protein